MKTGALVGLFLAGVFSIVLVLNALVHGGTIQMRRGGEVPLFPLLPLYVVSGAVTGSCLGLLFPLICRGPWFAYLSGVLGSIPFFWAIITAFGGSPTAGSVIISASFCSMTLGGVGGLIVRDSAC